MTGTEGIHSGPYNEGHVKNTAYLLPLSMWEILHVKWGDVILFGLKGKFTSLSMSYQNRDFSSVQGRNPLRVWVTCAGMASVLGISLSLFWGPPCSNVLWETSHSSVWGPHKRWAEPFHQTVRNFNCPATCSSISIVSRSRGHVDLISRGTLPKNNNTTWKPPHLMLFQFTSSSGVPWLQWNPGWLVLRFRALKAPKSTTLD